MTFPTRIAITLTTAITALMALSAEVKMSHPVHVLCVIVGGAILGLIVHPSEGGTLAPTPGEAPPPIPLAATQDQPL
jgi:hypothetical protein